MLGGRIAVAWLVLVAVTLVLGLVTDIMLVVNRAVLFGGSLFIVSRWKTKGVVPVTGAPGAVSALMIIAAILAVTGLIVLLARQ